MNDQAITIAIMAGGKSRRMGRDKAFVEVGGVPMLERVVIAALGTGLPVMVVGRERPEGWRYDDVRFVVDRIPDRGPLGGLATALEESGTAVLALACDMPFITIEALQWLIERASVGPSQDGVVTVSEGRLQPLFAVYAASSLRWIESLLDQNKSAVKDLIASAKFREIAVDGPFLDAVRNVNDEEQVRRLEHSGRGFGR